MKTLIIIILFSLSIRCEAQNADSVYNGSKTKKWTLNGYVKDMQTLIFTDIKGKWINENLFHNRLNFKYTLSNSINIAIEARNRLLYGNIMKSFPGYGDSFEADKGLFKISENIYSENYCVLNTAIDRAYIDYSKNKFQFTLGRQRINWGQTFVWNANDIFNTYSYFDFDYEEKPGSDAVRMQYYANATSVLEIAVKSDNNKNITAASLYRFNRYNYDIQFIGGITESKYFTIGTGWSGQVFKGGFRGEASYFHPKENIIDTTGVLVISAGYDYTFKNSLFLQFEALYNSNKEIMALSLIQSNNNSLNASNPFLSDVSLFGSLSYPLTPLINTSLAGIENTKNRIYFIIPSVNISVKENLELSFIAQLFRYYGKGLGNQRWNFIFARLKKSF